jgi:DNA-binding transcriptional regulator PaaX
MGTLEKDVKRRERYGKLETMVLATLSTIGILSVALIAPNALQMFGKAGWSKKTGYNRRQGIEKAVHRLHEKDLIRFEKKNDRTFVRITEKGKRVLENINRRGRGPRVRPKWDKKWRVVIFDITEQKRSIRDKLRAMLATIGFAKLQDSVWVYPYDCEELITLLKADFRMGKDVLYIIADAIENDKSLRSHFGI